MKKVILITGVSSGLGKTIAEYLAELGHTVYGGMRAPQKSTIKKLHYIKLDVTSDKNVKAVVATIIRKEKKIDALINNAGITLVGATDSFSVEEYLDILNINSVGAFRLIREVLPHMKKKKLGKVITVSSLNGLVSFPNFGLYSSSKFAVDSLSHALYYELRKTGIDVVTISLGAIYNPNADLSKMPHKPAREKFPFLKLIFPMVTKEKIARRIEEVIKGENLPSRLILGNDAVLLSIINRILPCSLWDKLMLYVWQK